MPTGGQHIIEWGNLSFFKSTYFARLKSPTGIDDDRVGR